MAFGAATTATRSTLPSSNRENCHLVPRNHQPRLEPALEVKGKDGPLPGAPAAGDDVVLVQQIGGTGRDHLLEMPIGQLQREPPIRDDLVPVVADIVLRHRWDCGEVSC